jgi:hypothetical protein
MQQLTRELLEHAKATAREPDGQIRTGSGAGIRTGSGAGIRTGSGAG